MRRTSRRAAVIAVVLLALCLTLLSLSHKLERPRTEDPVCSPNPGLHEASTAIQGGRTNQNRGSATVSTVCEGRSHANKQCTVHPRTNNDIVFQYLRKVTGEDPFAKPKAVAVTIELKEKAARIKQVMKQVMKEDEGAGNTKAPQTLDEATDYLLRSVCFARFPTGCFEHDGVFYFSGGTSTKLIEDFSSGFAIRKGESKVYTWSPSAKGDGDKDK